MFEIPWKKHPQEKREFVNKETHEPVEKPVLGPEGAVIGMASGPGEEHQMQAEAAQEFKEAA